MVDKVADNSSGPSCSSCTKLQEAIEASKNEHALTLKMVKEKIISTDELIKKYHQKCSECDKYLQQVTELTSKLDAAQMKIESIQSQFERSQHSTEPLRKNLTRLHREKTLAESTITELTEKLQKTEKLYSELISATKLKEERECAWRLEQQIQAQELQKLKKSLEKSGSTLAKLQVQVKEEKDYNKEVSRSLGSANRKVLKLEKQLEKSKEEILSLKDDLKLAKSCGGFEEERSLKTRRLRKPRQSTGPLNERKQVLIPDSSPNRHERVENILQEIKASIRPVLSPLLPSPNGPSESNSSCSEEKTVSENSSSDEKASEDNDSDSSLGDLADILMDVGKQSDQQAANSITYDYDKFDNGAAIKKITESNMDDGESSSRHKERNVCSDEKTSGDGGKTVFTLHTSSEKQAAPINRQDSNQGAETLVDAHQSLIASRKEWPGIERNRREENDVATKAVTCASHVKINGQALERRSVVLLKDRVHMTRSRSKCLEKVPSFQNAITGQMTETKCQSAHQVVSEGLHNGTQAPCIDSEDHFQTLSPIDANTDNTRDERITIRNCDLEDGYKHKAHQKEESSAALVRDNAISTREENNRPNSTCEVVASQKEMLLTDKERFDVLSLEQDDKPHSSLSSNLVSTERESEVIFRREPLSKLRDLTRFESMSPTRDNQTIITSHQVRLSEFPGGTKDEAQDESKIGVNELLPQAQIQESRLTEESNQEQNNNRLFKNLEDAVEKPEVVVESMVDLVTGSNSGVKTEPMIKGSVEFFGNSEETRRPKDNTLQIPSLPDINEEPMESKPEDLSFDGENSEAVIANSISFQNTACQNKKTAEENLKKLYAVPKKKDLNTLNDVIHSETTSGNLDTPTTAENKEMKTLKDAIQSETSSGNFDEPTAAEGKDLNPLKYFLQSETTSGNLYTPTVTESNDLNTLKDVIQSETRSGDLDTLAVAGNKELDTSKDVFQKEPTSETLDNPTVHKDLTGSSNVFEKEDSSENLVIPSVTEIKVLNTWKYVFEQGTTNENLPIPAFAEIKELSTSKDFIRSETTNENLQRPENKELNSPRDLFQLKTTSGKLDTPIVDENKHFNSSKDAYQDNTETNSSICYDVRGGDFQPASQWNAGFYVNEPQFLTKSGNISSRYDHTSFHLTDEENVSLCKPGKAENKTNTNDASNVIPQELTNVHSVGAMKYETFIAHDSKALVYTAYPAVHHPPPKQTENQTNSENEMPVHREGFGEKTERVNETLGKNELKARELLSSTRKQKCKGSTKQIAFLPKYLSINDGNVQKFDSEKKPNHDLSSERVGDEIERADVNVDFSEFKELKTVFVDEELCETTPNSSDSPLRNHSSTVSEIHCESGKAIPSSKEEKQRSGTELEVSECKDFQTSSQPYIVSSVSSDKRDLDVESILDNLEDFCGDFLALSPLPPSPGCCDEEGDPDIMTSRNNPPRQQQRCHGNVASSNETAGRRGNSLPNSNKRYLKATDNSGVVLRGEKRTFVDENSSQIAAKSAKTEPAVRSCAVKSDRTETNPVQKSLLVKRPMKLLAGQAGKSYNKDLKIQRMSPCEKLSPTTVSKSLASKRALQQPTPKTNKTNNDELSTKRMRPCPNLSQKNGSSCSKLCDEPAEINGIREQDIAGTLDVDLIQTEGMKDAQSVTNKEDVKGKCCGLSVRPVYMPEVKYVLRCLVRVYEGNVQLDAVIQRFTNKKCISSTTPVTSAIVQFLKQRDDNLMPRILQQFKEYELHICKEEWKPVLSDFESRLVDVISCLSQNSLFKNFISQLVALSSRCLISSCRGCKDAEFKGMLSLCRMLAAVCKLNGKLSCIRVVCYDVIRSLHDVGVSALELVISVITVWPEVLQSFSKETPSLLYTLRMVLLFFVNKSSSTDLGNVLRRLCHWNDEPSCIENALKDRGLELAECLRNESLAVARLSQDGSLVPDNHCFNVVKSLELLSYVLGWEWTLNTLIINNIWEILRNWAAKEATNPLRDIKGVGSDTKNAQETENDSSKKAGHSNDSVCCCDILITLSCSSSNGRDEIPVASTAHAHQNRRLSNGDCRDMIGNDGGRARDFLESDQPGQRCSVCGRLKESRLPESQVVLCIQLTGLLCRIAVENGQNLVAEVMDLFCGLLEHSSASPKVTYVIQLAAAMSLLEISPWQPDRVAATVGGWLTRLKKTNCSLSPTCVAKGLVCLNSIRRSNGT